MKKLLISVALLLCSNVVAQPSNYAMSPVGSNLCVEAKFCAFSGFTNIRVHWRGLSGVRSGGWVIVPSGNKKDSQVLQTYYVDACWMVHVVNTPKGNGETVHQWAYRHKRNLAALQKYFPVDKANTKAWALARARQGK